GLRRAVSGSDSRGQPVREGKPVAGARRRSRGAAQTERTHRDPFSKVRAQERELTRMLPRESATLEERTRDVAALAKRTNKAAVLVVQQFPVAAVENVGTGPGVASPPAGERIGNVMGFVELGAAADLNGVLDAAAIFDWVVVDCDRKLPESAAIVETARTRVAPERLLFYSDNQVWFD